MCNFITYITISVLGPVHFSIGPTVSPAGTCNQWNLSYFCFIQNTIHIEAWCWGQTPLITLVQRSWVKFFGILAWLGFTEHYASLFSWKLSARVCVCVCVLWVCVCVMCVCVWCVLHAACVRAVCVCCVCVWCVLHDVCCVRVCVCVCVCMCVCGWLVGWFKVYWCKIGVNLGQNIYLGIGNILKFPSAGKNHHSELIINRLICNTIVSRGPIALPHGMSIGMLLFVIEGTG